MQCKNPRFKAFEISRRPQRKMSKQLEVAIVIFCVVKGYHQCPFHVNEGEIFSVRKKRGERGNAFKVLNDRGQLGHLQSELVSPLWPLQTDISA